MYQKIKELADVAIALQNKDKMDAALKEISQLCTVEHVTYGKDKSYNTEAEMVADIQGIESPVIGKAKVVSAKIKGGAK